MSSSDYSRFLKVFSMLPLIDQNFGCFSIFSHRGAIIIVVSNKIGLTFLEIMKPNVRRKKSG